MAKSSAGGEDVFNVDKIRRLTDLMKEYDLTEVDLKQSEQQIRLVRGGAAPVAAYPAMPMAAPMAMPAAANQPGAGQPGASAPGASAPGASAPGASAPAGGAPAAAEADGPHIAIIKSPMVGTFYNRANPKAEPFVKVGSVVTPETTVCIIEAMKVFNEIPAEVRGTIVAVLVENETPVDFDRPLFKVDTRG